LHNVLELHQASAAVYVTSLEPGSEVVHRLGVGRDAFVYLIAGAASCEREDLAAGDAARVSDQREVTIRAWQTSELIVVDMPA
jgi:redox-sensitive bicupin YhaK (pirin superfamily)